MTQFHLSKKPIVQLNVIEEHGLLIILTESIISVYPIPQITPGKPLSIIKKSSGAFMYAIDRQESKLRIAIAIKKKLILMDYDEALSEFIEKRELNIPDQARSVVWFGDDISVGLKSEYITLDANSASQIYERIVEKGTIPCTYLLPDRNVLEIHNISTVYVLSPSTGKSIWNINFAEAPIMFAYSYPYVLSITSKGIEIRPYFQSTSIQQFIALTNLKFISSDYTHNINIPKKDSVVYLASKKQLWALKPVPLQQQVESLKKDRAFPEALEFCEAVTDSDLEQRSKLIADCKLRLGFKKFSDGIYHVAFKYFSDLHIEPIALLSLFGSATWVWSKEAGPILPVRIQKIQASKNPLEPTKFVENSLTKALSILITYLLNYRKSNPQLQLTLPKDSIAWEDVEDLATLLDTCILLISVQLKEKSIIEILLKNKNNHCHLRKCESVLQTTQNYDWLIQLYYTKNEHLTALNYLKELSKVYTGPFSGPFRTMDYLIQLGPEWWEIIKKFSQWVIETNLNDSYKIFTCRDKDKMLPPLDVLDFLKNIYDKFEDIERKSSSRFLIITFLEYMINVEGSTIPELHNELIYFYLKQVLFSKQQYCMATGTKPSKYVVAGSEPNPLGQYRTKLINFLQKSSFYNAPKIHALGFPLEENAMFEEKAILYSKDGRHNEALKLIVYKMKELETAENYCSKNYQSKDGDDVYLEFFKVLIEPQPDTDETLFNLNYAIDILNKYSNQIDISTALELLPPSTFVRDLEAFLKSVLRHKYEVYHNGKILLNISKTQSMKIDQEYNNLRNRPVKISIDTCCSECKKRIGDAIFAVYESNIYHYRCYPQKPS